MKVNVRLVGSLRGSGKGLFSMNMDNGTSLKTAVGQIAARSAALKRILTVAGLNEHSSSLLILVNEKDSSVLNGLETPLRDGDEVVLIPVIHGG